MTWLQQLRIEWEERSLAGLDALEQRFSKKKKMPPHLITGLRGEDAAFFYLRRKGYIVVARRWSLGTPPGDIDLIAWQGPILCFIEVKTRTAHDIAPAEIAVDEHKRNTLRRLARRYVWQLKQPEWPVVRFDILSVYLIPGKEKEFVHFEGAFSLREKEWK